MFDNYYQSPSSVSVHVTEKRAPTDESLKLLREMEKEVEGKVLNTIRIEDNKLNAIVVESLLDNFGMDKVIHVLFTLNGKRYHIKEVVSVRDAALDHVTALEKAARAVANAITAELVPYIAANWK